jgi:hypothetical protein
MVKFVTSCCSLLLVLAASPVASFAPSPSKAFVGGVSVSTNTAPSTTAIYISSWGVKGPPAFRQAERLDPEKRIQDYLPEPAAVEARSNIDGTILVSGAANTASDQFLFDLLNHQDSAFEFTTIKAFVDDAAFSKKRLLSRSARYTGLLDKLQFEQAAVKGGLPTAEQLQGAKSWLAVLEPSSDMIAQCHEIARTAATVGSLKNVAVLLTGANELDGAKCRAVVDDFKSNNDSSKQSFTIVAVGKLEERPEGSTAYHYGTFGADDAVLPAKAVFAREEAYRMITELLQLECGVNQALTFAEVYNVNVTEAKLIRGLREAGYARPQEIDHMVRQGPAVRCSFNRKTVNEILSVALAPTQQHLCEMMLSSTTFLSFESLTPIFVSLPLCSLITKTTGLQGSD